MTAMRRYAYIGPKALRLAARDQPGGTVIRSSDDLRWWLVAYPEGLAEGATFVVDLAGQLRLAPRRSEHVRCAGGEPVLAAGEMAFIATAAGPVVSEVTNQSTGYCPEPESWPAVAAALACLDDRAVGVSAYTTAYVFRRCPACRQLNLVKESWFYCAACGAALPPEWNLDRIGRPDDGPAIGSQPIGKARE